MAKPTKPLAHQGALLPTIPKRIPMGDISDARMYGEGICVACACHQDNVDRGAVNVKCDDCGERMVFGVEQIVILGLIEADADETDADEDFL